MTDRSAKMALIGAGPVGLGMAKALLEHKIPYEELEADDDLGGNWYHGVYETVHIISSRKTTEYADYPMPEHYPDFPSRQQMLEYLLPAGKIRIVLRHGVVGVFRRLPGRNDVHGLIHSVIPVSAQVIIGFQFFVGNLVFEEGLRHSQTDGSGADQCHLCGTVGHSFTHPSRPFPHSYHT